MGTQVLSATPNDAPEKLFYLKMHMTMGLVILVLMIVRLAIRFFATKPPAADTGNTVLNKLGVATHYLFYLVVILMALSGLATANLAGLARDSLPSGEVSQAFLDKAATEQLVGISNVIPLILELVLGSFQPKLFGERRH